MAYKKGQIIAMSKSANTGAAQSSRTIIATSSGDSLERIQKIADEWSKEAVIPSPIDVSKGLIQTPKEYVTDVKNTASYRERASQTPAELSLVDRLNLDGAKKKYTNGEKMSIPEIAAVLRYSKNAADFAETKPKSIGTTLAELTGKEIKKQVSPLETFSDKAKAPIVEPTKDIVKKFVTALDEKSVSYLDKNEQDEYNRKKAVDEIAAGRYLESKSDKIAMRQGVEMAQKYINGNFGEKALNGLYIWIGTGVSDVGWGDSFTAFESMISGKDMPENITYPEEYANAYLANYFAENGKLFEKAIQDIVVNTANNMVAGAPGAVMGALTQNKTFGDTIGRLSFALSVFGNTYRNEVENGHNSKDAALYALATTATETSLESVLGAIPGVGGEFVEGLAKKCGNAVGRFFIKLFGNAAGEYIEEGTQTLLDPFLRKWILGEDVKTVANDMKNQLGEANYSGIIGAISAIFMSGFGTVADIRAERNIENYGKMYKEILAQTDSNVKDLANYGLAVADKKSELYKVSKDIVDGKIKETDYNAGKLYVEAVRFFESANIMVNSFTGSQIKQKDSGVQNLLADFDRAVSEGAIFNDVITLKADKIRQSIENGAEISDYDIGAFARMVEFNTPAAYIHGEVNQMQSKSNPELQSSANGDMAIDEMGDDGVAVNSQLQSGENGGAQTDTSTRTDGRVEVDGDSFFDEPSADFPKADFIADAGARLAGVERHSDGQRTIIEIGRKLGYKVIFDPDLKNRKGALANGKIDYDNKTIYLNPKARNVKQWILKHELVHYGKQRNAEAFNAYKDVAKRTDVFYDWIKDKFTEKFVNKDADFKNWLNEQGFTEVKRNKPAIAVLMLAEVCDKRIKDYAENGENIGRAKAEEEIIGDFSGDVIFSNDEAGMEKLLKGLDRKQHNAVVQFVLDFISYLKEKFMGNKQMTLELKLLESRYIDMLRVAKNNPTAQQSGGVDWSFGVAQSDIDNYVEAAYRNENQEDYKKYSVASDKLIHDVSTEIDINGYAHALRDNDIRHIRNSHGEQTNEKYPVTSDDIKRIPWIVNNYDKVFVKTNSKGKFGIVYVKVAQENIIYYVEAVTEEYHNEKLLVNKQMVKTGIDEIPNLHGLISAINKKESSSQYLADLQEIRKAYVQDVKENYSTDSISQNEQSVNTNSTPKNEDYSLDHEESPETATENGVDIDSLIDRYDRGEISREDFTEQLDTLWGEAVQQYGAFTTGEKAVTPVPVPKAIDENKPVERFIRTVIETGKLTEEMFEGISADILLGNFSYTAVSDKNAIKKAKEAVANKSAENRWDEVVMGRRPNKNDIAIGEILLTKASDDGDTRRVMELSSELADIFTQAGQVAQAARLLKEMTGAGRLVSLQRTVKTLNRDLHARHKGKPISDIKIPETLARQLATAKTREDVETVYQDILQTVAGQMPVTFMDKLNAWRYFAMLCNPRTHIRNLTGNAIFLPAVRIKDFIAVGLETAFVKTDSRTKVLKVKKEYADFARADARRKDVKALLKGNKYNDKSALREKQRIFKSAVLEFLTTFNSGAMEAEDAIFKNIHYIHALGGFLQARGIDIKTVSDEVLLEARIYAVNEARKATFNDESALAKKMQKFAGKNIATEIFIEGNIPFKRTPINIVKRGVEYSPLGLVATITKGAIDVKRGNMTATEFIDGISAGLTGTGIMLLGLAAAMWGVAQGGDDDDDRTVFEKMLGKQEYSINLLGKSYTVDWAAPSSIPFFIGVEIAEIVKDDGRITFANFTDVIWNALEPITNLSMLSGIQNTISSVRYADNNQIFGSIIGDTLTSYGMQYLPSTFGAVARTVDPKQRTWYVDKNSELWGSMAQGAINNFKSKVPGLSYTMPEKIDAWGREVDRGGVGERFAENFISPGYYSAEEKDAVDTELIRLGEETGENVYPRTAAKSFSVNGETKYLTADEWVKYAKAKGKYSHDYVTEFINSKVYKELSDDERAGVISKLYEYANAKAKTHVSKYDLMGDGSKYKTATHWEKKGKSVVTFYIDSVVNN